MGNGEIIVLETVKGDLSVSSDVLVASRGYWNQISTSALVAVGEYLDSNPLRRGMPREELKSKLKISSRLYSGLVRKLIQDGSLQEEGPLVLKPGHEIQFSSQQEQSVEKLLQQFAASPYSPPSIKDSKSAVGDDVYQAMVDLKLLTPVSAEVVFRTEDYHQMVGEVKELLSEVGTVSVAQVRDHFNTSRKYVLALLEHMDEIGVTVRQGDVRRLK